MNTILVLLFKYYIKKQLFYIYLDNLHSTPLENKKYINEHWSDH